MRRSRWSADADHTCGSPALDVVLAIQHQGAAVWVYDPHAMGRAWEAFPTIAHAATALQVCVDEDVALHLTEWREFREMGPAEVGQVVRTHTIVDGRNAIDREAWTREGWTHRAIGRPSP